jgi:O-glycosyl hydrolase
MSPGSVTAAAHSPVDGAATGAAVSASGASFRVTYDNKSFATSLPPSSIATYTWTPGSNTVSETETETSAGSLVNNVELAPQPNLSFGVTSKSLLTVAVKPSVSMQPITGFGGAMTQSAAELINNSRSDKQIMDALFDRSGADFSIVRVPMGASDFVTGRIYQGDTSYSYDDNGGKADPGLAKFSVGTQTHAGEHAVPCVPARSPGDYGTGDYADTIPALQCAKSLNPSLNLLAVPWSAPGWMKIKDPTIPSACPGSDDVLQPSYYDLYAAYFVKFLEAYQTVHLPVSEVSMQNEPENCSTSYPTMEMTPASQATFAVDLHDNLTDSSVKAKLPVTPAIMAYDHNYLNSWNGHASGVTDYPEQVIKQASGTVGMVGFHHYNGSLAQEEQALDKEHTAHPKVPIWMTEATGTYGTSTPAQNLVWEGQHDLMEPLQNWARASLYLNLVLNSAGGPHHGGCGHKSTACRGMITLHADGKYSLNEDYYDWAQFSKFIHPGATHICSSIIDLSASAVHKCTSASSSWIPTNGDNLIDTVAFRNRNGSVVLVAINTTPTPTPRSSTWTAAEAPQPANGTGINNLGDATCVSADNCVAVGTYAGGALGGDGLIEMFNSGAWTPLDAPLPPELASVGVDSTTLASVACPSAASCIAVGSYMDVNQNIGVLIETLQGDTWKAIEGPTPAGGADGGLSSISCTSASFCVAVGTYTDSSGDPEGLIDTLNHGTWTAIEAPPPPGTSSPQLDRVSCGASGTCIAISPFSAAIDVLANGTWTAANLPLPANASSSPPPGQGVNLNAIACPSATSCVIAGIYPTNQDSEQGMLEDLSGNTWNVTEAPLPDSADTAENVELDSAACSSTHACVVAGLDDEYAGTYDSSVIDTMSNGNWTPTTTPAPATIVQPPSTACTAQACVIVGDDNESGLIDTDYAGTWGDSTAPVPTNAESADGPAALYTVKCVPAGYCIALGTYENKTGGDDWVLERESP